MERIILMVIKSLFNLPMWYINILKFCHVEKYEETVRYAFLKSIVTKVNKRGRIRIEAFGTENLPKENGYILYPNHQGLFDALAIIECHDKPFTTVSKKEVENLFVIKYVFKILQAKFIDRDDVRQSMKIMIEVTKDVKEGRNYLIFPEGTRSKNGNSIGPFKGGSFKSAMNARCPIVPVAMIDAFKVFDTHSIKKATVQIHYLEPLYYEDYKDMKSVEIADLVSERIKKTIAENEYR